MCQRNIDCLPLACPQPGAWPATQCPDGELNWQPFGSQARAQSTESHQPGHIVTLLKTEECAILEINIG